MSSMPRMLITASAAAPQALQTFVQPKYLVGEVLGSWNYDMGTTSCSGGRSAFVNSALKCFAVSSKICVARSVNAGQRVMNERGSCGCLVCGRRKFFGFVGGGFFAELASPSYAAQNGDEEYMKILERMHPQRPDWYEEIYAQSMLLGMQSYEAEVAAFKVQLFDQLDSTVEKIVELGIGTGPNMKYYANRRNMTVIGVDPNRHMEKYAQEAAYNAGLNSSQFEFLHAVAERLPIPDSSVDAVVCTLVMCSVKDVSSTLKEVQRVLKPRGKFVFIEHVAAKEGTWLRFWQKLLSPLQLVVADGCHLDRDTLECIQSSGFTSLKAKSINIKSVSLVSPHILGIAQI